MELYVWWPANEEKKNILFFIFFIFLQKSGAMAMTNRIVNINQVLRK